MAEGNSKIWSPSDQAIPFTIPSSESFQIPLMDFQNQTIRPHDTGATISESTLAQTAANLAAGQKNYIRKSDRINEQDDYSYPQ